MEDRIHAEYVCGELATLEEMREILAKYGDIDTVLFDDQQVIDTYFKFLDSQK